MHGDPVFGFEALPRRPGSTPGAEDLPAPARGKLLMLDPPDHTRLRRMLTGEFTVRAMAAWSRASPRSSTRPWRSWPTGPPADLVADFALPMPSLVICELLGSLPATARASRPGGPRARSDIRPEAEVVIASREYMATLVARARREPGDDLIGMLVREHGDTPAAEGGIDDDELAGLANLLLVAGHETTSNVIALGTLALLRDPAQIALLRAAVDGPDPAAPHRAVEEMLRSSRRCPRGPRGWPRRRRRRDHAIPAGTIVTASLCAANRDPALGADHPGELDLAREPLPTSPSATASTTAWGRRWRGSSCGSRSPHCCDASRPRPGRRPAQLEYRHDALIHGVEALPVTW